ncbi:MAG: hypothetical protein GXP49_12845 [Deltaproteobacteria bacterium]|nr:hypothetical protein [Deltaproteobacteria bacterium]
MDAALHNPIVCEIAETGPVPFDVFMEKALFSREHGYYQNNRPPGTRGDFFTAADIGPGLSQLLANQIMKLFRPERGIRIIELGPGSGKVLAGILDIILKNDPNLFENLEVLSIEKGRSMLESQKKVLHKFESRISWLELCDMKNSTKPSFIFGNEFIDALPVKRFVRKGGKLMEIFVAARDDGRLEMVECEADENKNMTIGQAFSYLPDNCMFESRPGLKDVMGELSRVTGQGVLMLIDYGDEAELLYGPNRLNGTVRAYEKHRLADPLENPGSRDITASVDFTALKNEAVLAGWHPVACLSLTKAAMVLGAVEMAAGLALKSDRDSIRAKMSLMSLVFPRGLGAYFKVFIADKGMQSGFPTQSKL